MNDVPTILAAAFAAPLLSPGPFLTSEGREVCVTVNSTAGGAHTLVALSPVWKEGTYSWTTAQPEHLASSGAAFLYRFPFTISCSNIRDVAIEFRAEGGARVRVFPPFEIPDDQPARYIPWSSVPAAGPNPRQRFDVFARVPLTPAVAGVRECAGWRIDLIVPTPAPVDGIPLEGLAIGNPEAALRHLLRLIRYRTRQWWIGRDNGPRQGPITATFPVAGNSIIHGFPANLLEQPQSYELPLALDDQMWLGLFDDLGAGYSPPAYDARLLDAYYFCAAKDVDACVLSLAQALEIARTVHLERAAKLRTGNPSWTLADYLENHRELGRNRWALPRHLGDIAQAIVGQNFISTNAQAAEMMNALWSCRGNVAHGHTATYARPDGTQTTASPAKLSEWFPDVRAAIAWLEAL